MALSCVIFFSTDANLIRGQRILATSGAMMGHPVEYSGPSPEHRLSEDGEFILVYGTKRELEKPKIGSIWANEVMVVGMSIKEVWVYLAEHGRDALRALDTLEHGFSMALIEGVLV
jgi:hypothetical protein